MSKSKVSKNKKLLLGSALAGLVVAGPGLSVTVGSASGRNFFQSAELEVGYRLAQAVDKKVEAAATAATAESKPSEVKKDGDKHCSGDMKCGGDKKCGAAGKHCGADKKPSATPAPTDGKKSDASKSCGAGSCGGHQ